MVSLGKEYGLTLKVRKKSKGKCVDSNGLKKETAVSEPLEVPAAGAAASGKKVAGSVGDGISPLASRSPTPTCSSSAKLSPPPSLLAVGTSASASSSPHGFVSISKTASSPASAAGGEAAAEAIASEAGAGASFSEGAEEPGAACSRDSQSGQAHKTAFEPNFFKPTRCSSINNSSSNPSSPRNATPNRKGRGGASQRKKKKTPSRVHESPLPHFMTPRSELDAASPSCSSKSISALEAMLEKEKEVRRERT